MSLLDQGISGGKDFRPAIIMTCNTMYLEEKLQMSM